MLQFRELCHLVEACQPVKPDFQFPFVPFLFEGLYDLLFGLIGEVDLFLIRFFYVQLFEKRFQLRFVGDEILCGISREDEKGYVVLKGSGSTELIHILHHHLVDFSWNMPMSASMGLEAFFQSRQAVHGVGGILHLYDTVRISEQDISIRHFYVPELDGSGVLYEAYSEWESSWDDFLDGVRFFPVQ